MALTATTAQRFKLGCVHKMDHVWITAQYGQAHDVLVYDFQYCRVGGSKVTGSAASGTPLAGLRRTPFVMSM